MRIGELSRRSGVGERLLRYYKSRGLLHPRREPSGYRVFTGEDLRVVRRIRLLLAAGLSTATIARALPCVEEAVSGLVPTCPRVVADLAAERDRIDREITELRGTRARLDAVLAASAGAGSGHGSGDEDPEEAEPLGGAVTGGGGIRDGA